MKKMIILITGTPGVGKTTVSSILAEKLAANLIDINELVDEKHLYTGIDEERGYKIVDLDALFKEIDEIIETLKHGVFGALECEAFGASKSEISNTPENQRFSGPRKCKFPTAPKIPQKSKILREFLSERDSPDKYIIIEGHLSHLFDTSDLVIVLRANPDVLRDRMKIKGWKEAKIRENIEAEAIDVCSYESFEIHGDKVNEIDTSDISPEKVVDLIISVINGDERFPVGSVDFLEYLGKF